MLYLITYRIEQPNSVMYITETEFLSCVTAVDITNLIWSIKKRYNTTLISITLFEKID